MSQKFQTTQNQSNDNDTEPTLREVIKAINTSSAEVSGELFEIKEEIYSLKQEVTGIKQEMTGVKQEVTGIKQEVTGIKDRLDHIENVMVTKQELKQELAATETRLVTKEYLDDKISDLKGYLVGLVRKEDRKVNTVVSILHSHQVLTGQDLQQIDQVQLFPKTSSV